MIQQCRASGLRVSDWCRQNNIGKGNYYYRLRKVRQAMLESKKQTQIVDISDEICEAGVCSPNNSTYSNGLSITIDNAVIQVEPSTSPELLRMVWGMMKDAK